MLFSFICSMHNIPSFRACCQLLANISGYQHTRKAWRKEAFELLLDNSFFQMNSTCIGYWRSIIDHLMTHDKTTFRDFMCKFCFHFIINSILIVCIFFFAGSNSRHLFLLIYAIKCRSV